MKVVYLLRKPLSEGTITANVLKHGTGAINIDACRTPTSDNLNGGAYSENASERHDGTENWRYKRGDHGSAGKYKQPEGRWPSNVILQHLDGCTDSSCVVECPIKVMGNNSRFYKQIGVSHE